MPSVTFDLKCAGLSEAPLFWLRVEVLFSSATRPGRSEASWMIVEKLNSGWLQVRGSRWSPAGEGPHLA